MDTISLHLGVSHFPPPSVAVQALQRAISLPNTYGMAQGLPELRKAVAQRYADDQGILVPEERVLITHGAKHALHLYLQCLLAPGDEVLVPAPYWFGFPEIVRLSGGKFISIPANPAQGYTLDLETIRRQVTPQTRLIIITNPGNPTGKVYSSKELEGLANLLEENPHLHLLADEVYDGLVYAPTPMHSVLNFTHLQERIAVVNSFSKSFAMTNWRIGYLLASATITRQALPLLHNVMGEVSPFIQQGALAALQHRHIIWDGFKEDLSQKKEKILNLVNALPGLKCFTPEAGYYITLEVENCLQSIPPSSPFELVEEWAASLKDQVGVEVLPATNMGMPTAVRVSFALPDKELEEALRRLKAFIS